MLIQDYLDICDPLLTFDMAVRDEIIRSNPTDRGLKEVKRGCGKQSGVRHSLTIEQQCIFMDYIENHPVIETPYIFPVDFYLPIKAAFTYPETPNFGAYTHT